MSNLAFLISAVCHPIRTGDFLPAQKSLAERMVSSIVPEKGIRVVELGAGTGRITEEILKKIFSDKSPLDYQLVSFEINPRLRDIAEARIKNRYGTNGNVVVINDDVRNMQAHIKNYFGRNGKVDYVISSLPFALFSRELAEEILEASYRSLRSRGKFIQYQHSLKSRKIIRAIFPDVATSFVPLNFPPAFVYTCVK